MESRAEISSYMALIIQSKKNGGAGPPPSRGETNRAPIWREGLNPPRGIGRGLKGS